MALVAKLLCTCSAHVIFLSALEGRKHTVAACLRLQLQPQSLAVHATLCVRMRILPGGKGGGLETADRTIFLYIVWGNG